MHSQKYNRRREGHVCESSLVCLHSSRNVSTPFETIPPSPKKQKQRELVVHMRSASYHGWSRTQCVVVDVLSVGWCAKRNVKSVPVLKNRYFVFLQKLLRKVFLATNLRSARESSDSYIYDCLEKNLRLNRVRICDHFRRDGTHRAYGTRS